MLWILLFLLLVVIVLVVGMGIMMIVALAFCLGLMALAGIAVFALVQNASQNETLALGLAIVAAVGVLVVFVRFGNNSGNEKAR